MKNSRDSITIKSIASVSLSAFAIVLTVDVLLFSNVFMRSSFVFWIYDLLPDLWTSQGTLNPAEQYSAGIQFLGLAILYGSTYVLLHCRRRTLIRSLVRDLGPCPAPKTVLLYLIFPASVFVQFLAVLAVCIFGVIICDWTFGEGESVATYPPVALGYTLIACSTSALELIRRLTARQSKLILIFAMMFFFVASGRNLFGFMCWFAAVPLATVFTVKSIYIVQAIVGSQSLILKAPPRGQKGNRQHPASSGR